MKSTLSVVGVIAIVLVVCLLAGGCTVGIWAVSVNNKAVDLERAITAQQGVCEVQYDTMKKTIFQEAQISDKYAEDFKKVFPEIIAGRYKGEGNPLLKFITESNPKFSTKLYAKLMVTIESQREKFKTEQKKLLDLVREHESLTSPDRFPHRFVVGGRRTPDITIVTSDDAKDAFRSGADNERDLFPKK